MMNWINKKRNKKGFTLVELVVVIAILGILAAIAVPRFTDVTASAKLGAAEANHRILVSAVQMAQTQSGGTLPATGLTSLDSYIQGTTTALNKTDVEHVWNGTEVITTVTGIQSAKYAPKTNGNIVITQPASTTNTVFTTTFTAP